MKLRQSLTVVLVLAVLIFTSCENALSRYIAQQEAIATGVTRPTLDGLVNGGWITGHENLVLTFDEPIDTASVTVSGTMVVNGYDISWDPTNVAATVSPQIGEIWPVAGVTFSIAGSTVSGKDFDSFDWDFVVFYGTCAGNVAGGGNGSVSQPFDVIQDAVDASINLYESEVTPPALPVVRIQSGSYSKNCDFVAGEQIIRVDTKMSISGMWNSDFQSQGTQESILIDTSTSGSAYSYEPSAPIVLETSSGLNDPDFIIEDLSVEISDGSDTHAGIYCHSGYPEINNVRIYGHTTTSAHYVYGIYSRTMVDVVDCDIDPGAGGLTYGVYIDKRLTGSTVGPNVYGGTISSGSGTSQAWGVAVYSDASIAMMGMWVDIADVIFTGESNVPAAGGGCVYSYDCEVEFDGNTFWQSDTSLDAIHLATNTDPADEYWMARSITNNDFDYNGDWYIDPVTPEIDQSNYGTQTLTVGGSDTRLLFNATWGNTSTFAP